MNRHLDITRRLLSKRRRVLEKRRRVSGDLFCRFYCRVSTTCMALNFVAASTNSRTPDQLATGSRACS